MENNNENNREQEEFSNVESSYNSVSTVMFEKEKIDINTYLEADKDDFFVTATNIYVAIMRVFNWIMRHTYLIVVVFIAILFFLQLGNK